MITFVFYFKLAPITTWHQTSSLAWPAFQWIQRIPVSILTCLFTRAHFVVRKDNPTPALEFPTSYKLALWVVTRIWKVTIQSNWFTFWTSTSLRKSHHLYRNCNTDDGSGLRPELLSGYNVLITPGEAAISFQAERKGCRNNRSLNIQTCPHIIILLFFFLHLVFLWKRKCSQAFVPWVGFRYSTENHTVKFFFPTKRVLQSIFMPMSWFILY